MRNKQYELYEHPQIHSYVDLVSIKYEKHRDKVAFAWYDKNELQKATYGDFANDICILADKMELIARQEKHIVITAMTQNTVPGG